MQKVNAEFVKYGFAGEVSLQEYVKATKEIGLWGSEKLLFEKYLKRNDHILDMGCGTGRITFPLYQLGYQNIVGLDVSREMLDEARRMNQEMQCNIEFVLGDATHLHDAPNTFDVVLFAYNGLMQIPWLDNRKKAFSEIARILKPGGWFIFTSHDMEAEQDSYYFWREERLRWDKGRQNPRLAEFGDVIYQLGDREMYMHVPRREEIVACIEQSNLTLIEDHFRTEIFEESIAVKEFSDECRFWICQKRQMD